MTDGGCVCESGGNSLHFTSCPMCQHLLQLHEKMFLHLTLLKRCLERHIHHKPQQHLPPRPIKCQQHPLSRPIKCRHANKEAERWIIYLKIHLLKNFSNAKVRSINQDAGSGGLDTGHNFFGSNSLMDPWLFFNILCDRVIVYFGQIFDGVKKFFG